MESWWKLVPRRNVFLRAMLGSLGLATAAGIVAAVSGGGDTVWRVVGTAFVTALASGLMMPLSSMLDREETRAAGLAGIAVVLVEFLLALVLIWEMAWLLFELRWEDELGLTMLFLGLASVLLAVSLKLAATPHSGLAGRVGVSTTALTLAAFLIAIWGPERLIDDEKWWESGSAVFTIGLLVLLSLVGAGTARQRSWRWLAPAAGAVALALWLSRVWIGVGSALGTVVFSVLVSVAVVVGHANLCLLLKLTAAQRRLRGAAIAAAMLTAGLVDLIVLNQEYPGIGWDTERLGRLSAAAAIAAACGSVALLALARIRHGADGESPAAELKVMRVFCPRCRKKQSIDIGDSSCKRCGLRISIRVEEPL